MNNYFPLVSVIVPNYNYARYLPLRMNSILQQSYQNFEIIILDDCSSDNSRDIIEKYRLNKHVSQIVYNNTNSGSTFKQWQKGLKLAKGKLIWIAESDDYADNTFLQKVIQPFILYPNIVFCYSNLYEVNEDGIIDWPSTKQHCHNKPSDRDYYTGEEFIKDRMTNMCSVCNASSVVFDRDAAMRIPSTYTDFKSVGDYFFWILLAEKGNVAKCDEYLDYFRRHSLSVTPKSIKNGIAPIEEYRIHRYFWKKHYLSGLYGLKVFLHKYESNVLNFKYNDKVKEEILETWDPYHIMIGIVRALCWKIITLLKV